jgi:hypothetical protein
MNGQTLLAALLFGGFFAVACLKACVPAAPGHRLRPGDLFRLPGRLERLRRSRWQWFAMVVLLLVLRLQQGLPLVLELTIALQFIVFLALPATERGSGNARA